MKKSFFFPLLGLLLLTFTRFKCVPECEESIVLFRIDTLQTANLDNRGTEPDMLTPGAQGFLQAYGFRVFMYAALTDPADSINLDESCTALFLDKDLSACRIFTVGAIPGSFPAGAEVSELFRYVDRDGRVPEYRAVQEAISDMSRLPYLGYIPPYDFVLATPVAEGSYQFELRLTTADSTVYSTTTQVIYLK